MFRIGNSWRLGITAGVVRAVILVGVVLSGCSPDDHSPDREARSEGWRHFEHGCIAQRTMPDAEGALVSTDGKDSIFFRTSICATCQQVMRCYSDRDRSAEIPYLWKRNGLAYRRTEYEFGLRADSVLVVWHSEKDYWKKVKTDSEISYVLNVLANHRFEISKTVYFPGTDCVIRVKRERNPEFDAADDFYDCLKREDPRSYGEIEFGRLVGRIGRGMLFGDSVSVATINRFDHLSDSMFSVTTDFRLLHAWRSYMEYSIMVGSDRVKKTGDRDDIVAFMEKARQRYAFDSTLVELVNRIEK